MSRLGISFCRDQEIATDENQAGPSLAHLYMAVLLGGVLASGSLLSARPVLGRSPQVETLSRTHISTATVTYL